MNYAARLSYPDSVYVNDSSLTLVAAAGAHAAEPVVRAVIFYPRLAGHCHKVISEDFPPLFEKYGSQLQIIGVNNIRWTRPVVHCSMPRAICAISAEDRRRS